MRKLRGGRASTWANRQDDQSALYTIILVGRPTRNTRSVSLCYFYTLETWRRHYPLIVYIFYHSLSIEPVAGRSPRRSQSVFLADFSTTRDFSSDLRAVPFAFDSASIFRSVADNFREFAFEMVARTSTWHRSLRNRGYRVFFRRSLRARPLKEVRPKKITAVFRIPLPVGDAFIGVGKKERRREKRDGTRRKGGKINRVTRKRERV